MAAKTNAVLKNGNRDFNNVLDSMMNLKSGGNLTIDASTTAGDTSLIINNAVSPYVQGTSQLYPLGTKLIYGGRTFRYAFMGGACTAGKLVQQAAHVAHHTNCLVINADAATLGGVAYSHAIGSRAICIDTAGDTDLTADQYAEGYLLVNNEESEGALLRIRTHLAHNHGVDPSVVIETYDPLTTAVVKNSSHISLVLNPYKDVVVAPTAETGAVVGATVIDMSDDNYGWLVTSGPAALLVSNANLVLGHRVVRSDSDAGGVMPDNGDDLTPVLGQVMATGVVDTEYALINLNIQ